MSLMVGVAMAFEAAVFGGYGFELSGSALPSAGVGLGGRAGVSLDRVYLGGALTHHLGSSSSAEGPGTSYRGHYSATYVAAEAGLDFQPWRLLLRPWVGGGAFVARGETVVMQVSATDNHVYPFGVAGFLAAYTFRPWFVGVDVRAVVVPAEGFRRTELSAFGTVGARL
jgi:hypothetical protein